MRIRLAVCSLIVALLGAIVATPALAQGTGQGHGQGQGQGKAKPNGGKKAVRSAEAAAVKYGFAPRDREIITTYYTQRASDLPPGLANRQRALPPGLEKQLLRNGTLPPGLSEVTGRGETVTVFTTLLRDGNLFYCIAVAPQGEPQAYQRSFQRVVQWIRITSHDKGQGRLHPTLVASHPPASPVALAARTRLAEYR